MKKPDQMRLVLAEAYDNAVPMNEIEIGEFGFDHAELGGLLLKTWGLPENLCLAVSWHHKPCHAATPNMEAAIVHLANAITHIAEDSSQFEHYLKSTDKDAWKLLHLDASIIDEVLDDAMPVFDEALDAILPARY